MPAAPSPLRNEAIAAALDRALTSSDRYVWSLLVRGGNLPGPRPNVELAAAFGEALAARGVVADPLVRELADIDERKASGTSAEAFLPFVAAHALVAYVARGRAVRVAWAGLHDLAGDTRKVVRDGVVSALVRAATAREGAADAFVAEAASWTDGYLQAAVALEIFAARPFLERVSDDAALRARLDEAVSVAEHANRAAERSQGRRRLLEVFETSLADLVLREGSLHEWLVERARAVQPELHAAFEKTAERLAKLGAPPHLLTPLRASLDAARPALRDPTDYRGPTRGRGRKAQGRTNRR